MTLKQLILRNQLHKWATNEVFPRLTFTNNSYRTLTYFGERSDEIKK